MCVWRGGSFSSKYLSGVLCGEERSDGPQDGVVDTGTFLAGSSGAASAGQSAWKSPFCPCSSSWSVVLLQAASRQHTVTCTGWCEGVWTERGDSIPLFSCRSPCPADTGFIFFVVFPSGASVPDQFHFFVLYCVGICFCLGTNVDIPQSD